MPLQLTPEELKLFLPAKPGLQAHCRRVAALALELAERLPIGPPDLAILQQAALLHHWSEPAPPKGSARLLSDIGCLMPPEEQPARRIPLPDPLHAILAELQGPASSAKPSLASRIIEVCNLYDEQIEWIPLEPRSVAEIVADLKDLAEGGILDASVVAALEQLTTRFRSDARRLPAALPAGAQVAHEALLTLSARREFELQELEQIAGRDPILAASLIQSANSALYAPNAPIRDLSRAIGQIGTNTARRVLLATALRPLMRASGLDEIWRHSVATGLWCQRTAESAGIADPDEAMLLGLVHDVGRVAVRYVSPEISTVFNRLLQRGCPPAWVETTLTGRDHGEWGAEILRAWNFPAPLVEAVRRHHQPERSKEKLAGLLYLAEFWICSEEDLPSDVWLSSALAQTGLTMKRLEELESEERPEDVLATLLAA